MNKPIIDTFRQGQQFVRLWPKRPELAMYFAEYRAVVLTRMLARYFPFFALTIFSFMLYYGGQEYLSQALVYSLFVLGMPLQALLLQGKKSQQPLPPALANWYRQGVSRLQQQRQQAEKLLSSPEEDIKLSLQRPSYMNLAQLLHLSYLSLKP
jgi:uncharacterized membrane protein YfbV (UPF0208 family)